MNLSLERVICPYCGYRMPIELTSNSNVSGLFVRCKGSKCKKRFSLLVIDGVQYTNILAPRIRINRQI